MGFDPRRTKRSNSFQVSRVFDNRFFALGIKNIQDECNQVSTRYRSVWTLRSSTDLMNEYGLSITYEDGCRELQPIFELFEPITIHGKILDSYYPQNRATAATIEHSILDPMNPLLTIYLKALDVSKTSIVWIGFSDSFETIINHEILHACGDSPSLRNEVRDGLLLHNMVCKEAIANLLRR